MSDDLDVVLERVRARREAVEPQLLLPFGPIARVPAIGVPTLLRGTVVFDTRTGEDVEVVHAAAPIVHSEAPRG